MEIEIKENSILILILNLSTIFIYTYKKSNYITKYKVDKIINSYDKTISNRNDDTIYFDDKHLHYIFLSDEENISKLINSEDVTINKMGLTILLENNKDEIIKYINRTR